MMLLGTVASSLPAGLDPRTVATALPAVFHMGGSAGEGLVDLSLVGAPYEARNGAAVTTTNAPVPGAKVAVFGSYEDLSPPYFRCADFCPILDGDFTIDGWVYFDQNTGLGEHTILGNYSINTWPDDNTFAVQFSRDLTSMALTHRDDANIEASLGSGLAVDTWHHFAIARSGSNIRFYVNGALVHLGPSSSVYGSRPTPFLIGRSHTNYQTALYGRVSDLRILKGVAVHTDNAAIPVPEGAVPAGYVLPEHIAARELGPYAVLGASPVAMNVKKVDSYVILGGSPAGVSANGARTYAIIER